MNFANPLSTVGLMLSLAGLVGSFFNIQLSQWLRDLLALLQKVDINKPNGTAEQKKALVECRIELGKLANPESYVVNFMVMLFIIFVLVDGLLMIAPAKADPLYPNICVALWVFLFFFTGMSCWLIWRGREIVRQIQSGLPSRATAIPAPDLPPPK